MIQIDKGKCNGCGRCVQDCIGNLQIVDRQAHPLREKCLNCGHCVAICPQNAVSMDDYPMSDVVDVTPAPCSAQALLDFIKSRRSIRQFQTKPVEREKLERIIQAGRFTPTGSNLQGSSYIVVQTQMQEFRAAVVPALGQMGAAMLIDPTTSQQAKGYAKRWVGIADGYAQAPDKTDGIFYDAPVALLILGNSVLDVGLAASNMELMVFAQDLGMLYSGFITRACSSPKVKELLHIPPNQNVLASLLIGYSNVQYQRTAPRKPAEIHWA